MERASPWYSEIRAIHDRHFDDPWQERLTYLNERYGLTGKDALAIHGPNVPPPWFNGDIEAVEAGTWVGVDPVYRTSGQVNSPRF